MKNFSPYLEKLLVCHDYVVVPGLGGFVVQSQPAEISTNSIIPASSVIGFNPLMQHNDGLLAMEISRSEQISYREAVNFINIQSEELKSSLRIGQQIQIGSLGSFQMDVSENLIFIPEDVPDFLPQNFGLKILRIDSIQRISDKKKEIRITVSTSRFYKYAAAVLLLIGLFVSTPRLTDVRKSETAGLTLGLLEKTENQGKTLPDKSHIQVQKAAEVCQQGVVEQETEKNFHVIVASLSTEKSAAKFCKELSDCNFKNAHVLDPINTYRIAIESFSDKDEAIKYMENLRKTDNRFETAWVLCD